MASRAALPGIDPGRAVGDLRELAGLTSDGQGAQRVCWTLPWDRARSFLSARLEQMPVDVEVDPAGNCWATLRGRRPESLVLGGHLDSVPGGGWLDGALGVLGGLEVLRALCAGAKPELTVKLVDWADEEGVSFGEDSLGARAATGNLDLRRLPGLRHRDGRALAEVLAAYGLSVEGLPGARSRLRRAVAYLELHIEQGPVLENLGLPLGAVTGTVGVQRHRVTFTGEAAHAGTTPMEVRRDSLAAAGRFALEVRRGAIAAGGVATVGSCVTEPGIATAVAARTVAMLDQRHPNAEGLNTMLRQAREAADEIAVAERVEVGWEREWEIEPVEFDERLVDLAADAVRTVAGSAHRLPSGALHDAAEVQRAGVPTAMIFCQSLRGLSHTPAEDTREEHLRLAVEALGEAAARVLRDPGSFAPAA